MIMVEGELGYVVLLRREEKGVGEEGGEEGGERVREGVGEGGRVVVVVNRLFLILVLNPREGIDGYYYYYSSMAATSTTTTNYYSYYSYYSSDYTQHTRPIHLPVHIKPPLP